MFAHHQVAKGVVAALLTCTRGTNVKMKALRTYENKRKTTLFLHLHAALRCDFL